MMMIPSTLIQLVALILGASSLATGSTRSPDGFGPSPDSARQNGPQIFNAVHNAMREFGSALYHNGMSLFPAVIPEGVLLYHGTHTREVPKSLEWLAFEIEHAEAFARCWQRPRHSVDGRDFPDPLRFTTGILLEDEGRPPKYTSFDPCTGHLHVYQASRPLNVLYIDGTAAGKTCMGTLDTQDILLAGDRSRPSFDDWGRAGRLCALARKWGIDGFIRMEPGFEVIYCDFSNGLKLVTAYQQPVTDQPGFVDDTQISSFEWVRAAAQRYNGIGSSRAVLDYSSMVSAFFYPINLTNPDPERPDLPRLSQASDGEISAVREHVTDAVARSISSGNTPVDWQGVTDMIVTRYAKRLPLIAETESIDTIRNEVNNLLNIYIDYSEVDDSFSAAQQRCIQFYLQPVMARTPEDELIYAAIQATATTICTALFKIRQLVVQDSGADEKFATDAAKQIARDLIDALGWPEWKECGLCQPNEVCLVAMWPIGNVEDHYNPSCVNFSALLGRRSYWWDEGRTPGEPPQLCFNGQQYRGTEESKNEEL